MQRCTLPELIPFFLLFYFGDRNTWPSPDDAEDLGELDLVVEDILQLWLEDTVDDSPMEKTTILGIRLRSTDLCLIQFYKKVKKLIEEWDFTCFGIIGPDKDMSRSKKTVDRVDIDGTMKRIDDSRLKSKRKKMVNDPRYVAPDLVETRAHRDGTQNRVPFTREEDDAIVRGVSEFPRKWVEIKLARPWILRNRTDAQIKDRYRFLEKKNCIQFKAVVGGKHV